MMQIVLSSIPVAVLVIALVGLKLPAWKAALAAFAVCATEAFALRGVGLGEIASCSLKGASTGLFPIGLIIVAALFTYAVVVESATFVLASETGLDAGRLVALAGKTALKYAPAIGTICLVLALGKTMGAAGMTQDLANGLVAATGKWYPAVSPIVGALGGFVTGSGTSSNVLFGSLQASIGTTEAEQLVFAASNIMGAGIGKVICPQSIILGCAATGLAGRESEVMKRAFRYFLFALALACASSFLMVLASKEIECVSQTGLL